MFSAIGNLATSRPKRMLLLAAIISIASLVASSGLPERLASQGFQDRGAESQKAVDEIAAAAKIDANASVIALVSVPDGGKIDSKDGREAVADAAKMLAADEDIASVSTPFDDEVPAAAAKQLTSLDGDSALVIAAPKPDKSEGKVGERLVELFEEDENVLLGGGVIAQHYVSTTVEKDLQRSELIAFPLLFLISLFVFRGLIAAALPLLIGGITIPLTFALIGVYNEMTSLSIFALNLTTGLGLGLAIDYSLLIVTRFREELAAGLEKGAAVKRTVATAGRTVTFSAFTVAGSAFALVIFPLKFLYSMALAGATVALASAAVALLILPAVLYLLGDRINKFSVSRTTAEQSTERWYGLAKGVMKRPVMITLLTTAIILVCALPLKDISFTSVDATVLPETNSAYIVADATTNDYPKSGANSSMFVIAEAGEDEAAKVTKLSEQIADVAGVESTQPPQYIGGDRWQINAFPEGLRYSETATDAVEATRALDTDLTVWVGGETAVFVDQRAAIIERVPLALLLIGLITFIVLFLMTGSVVLPIKTFIMNVFTLAATFGILTFIFGQDRLEGLLDYNGQGALEMTQPVLLFALAFGLATDYGVFLLGRIKEIHDQGVESNEAVALGVARTGRVITSAALLFCVAIGAFSLSSIVFIKELGIGTALAVAIDATIIRALLVPALMVLLGDYNWWAPRWMKRLHARIGLSEGPSAPAPATAG